MCKEHDTHDELAGLDDFDSAPVSKTGNGFSQREQARYETVGGTRSQSDTFHEETCPKCRGTGVWRSYSGYSSGNCFKCKGTGKLRFRTSKVQREAARQSAADRRARKAKATSDKARQWLADNPERAAWLKQGEDRCFEFAMSLHTSLFKYGSLTDKQVAAIDRSLEKQAARNAERAKQAAGGPDLVAVPTGRYLVDGVEFKLDNLVEAKGKWSGWVFVKSVDGDRFGSQRPGSRYTGKHAEQLAKVAADPKAAAIAYGIETGTCGVCGRTLTNPDSIAAGIGPVCASRF